MKYGARHLKRAIERHVVFPLSNLIATRQIQLGDLITVDFDRDREKLIFMKQEDGALVGGMEPALNAETALTPASSERAATSRALARRAVRQ